MENSIKKIKRELIATVGDLIDELQNNQLVQFKAQGKKYIYACIDGKEHWAVPVEERDSLKKLLHVIRQLDKKSKDIEIDELTAIKFMSRYYRMRSDILEVAHSAVVGYPYHDPDDETSEQSSAAKARINRTSEKMHSLDKLLSAANRRNSRKR
jgi:hypothetical protein